jgi:hypothetical protein
MQFKRRNLKERSLTSVFKMPVNCGENMEKKCGDYRNYDISVFLPLFMLPFINVSGFDAV